MAVPRLVLLLLLAIASLSARAEPPGEHPPPIDVALDLRYRYESVEQDGLAQSADANTLRIRANFATREYAGFSGLLEFDHVQRIGAEHYNDTRNAMTAYPVVADPEGTDLNQAWLQYSPRADTRVWLGRQRLNLDNQRFVGSSDWRQNEQTLDALRLETTALHGFTVNYAFVDRVNRVFGPNSGTPPEEFEGANHLFNFKMSKVASGSIVAYAYFLDFDDAPQLSSRSIGARYEGVRVVGKELSLGWALEFARQRDDGDNPLQVDATYALLELRVKLADADFFVGRELLSGVRGNVDPAASPAFQTPLATLHKWQGWADKFLSTPPAGIEDTYVGIGARWTAWRVQTAWHDFAAEATGQRYGGELDVLVAFTVAKRIDLVLKYADYRADDGFTDTRKAWAQVGVAF
jgi:hypothetical protein